MQKNRAFAESSHRQRKPHHSLAVERAKNLPAGFRSHDEQRHRLDFQILFPPDFLFQCNAAVKLFNTRAFSDDNPLAHQALRPSAATLKAPLSARFAVSQNSSICSRGTSARAFPPPVASSSIRRNRAENLALAFLRAISGSMCKYRARFTVANSKSPISSSVLPPFFALNAPRSSPASSLIFAKTPSTLSQSNPIRAARRVK